MAVPRASGQERQGGRPVLEVRGLPERQGVDIQRGAHDRRELRERPEAAQHARREQAHQGGRRRRSVEARGRRQRRGREAQGQQETAQGHGRTVDAEGKTELLRLQKPHQGRHEVQADTDAGGDARLGARLAADGHAAHGVGQRPAIVCRQRVCGPGGDAGEVPCEGRDMREGLPRPSADGGAEGDEQGEVADAKPRGAHLRVHGEHDEQAVYQDGWLGEGDGGDRADQPNLQHVALRANRQAQPAERLTEKKQQLADTYIHTNKPSKK